MKAFLEQIGWSALYVTAIPLAVYGVTRWQYILSGDFIFFQF